MIEAHPAALLMLATVAFLAGQLFMVWCWPRVERWIGYHQCAHCMVCGRVLRLVVLCSNGTFVTCSKRCAAAAQE